MKKYQDQSKIRKFKMVKTNSSFKSTLFILLN